MLPALSLLSSLPLEATANQDNAILRVCSRKGDDPSLPTTPHGAQIIGNSVSTLFKDANDPLNEALPLIFTILGLVACLALGGWMINMIVNARTRRIHSNQETSP